MRAYMTAESDRIEGAAGVAIAALEARKQAIVKRKIVVIICGGNVSQATLDAVI